MRLYIFLKLLGQTDNDLSKGRHKMCEVFILKLKRLFQHSQKLFVNHILPQKLSPMNFSLWTCINFKVQIAFPLLRQTIDLTLKISLIFKNIDLTLNRITGFKVFFAFRSIRNNLVQQFFLFTVKTHCLFYTKEKYI